MQTSLRTQSSNFECETKYMHIDGRLTENC